MKNKVQCKCIYKKKKLTEKVCVRDWFDPTTCSVWLNEVIFFIIKLKTEGDVDKN